MGRGIECRSHCMYAFLALMLRYETFRDQQGVESIEQRVDSFNDVRSAPCRCQGIDHIVDLSGHTGGHSRARRQRVLNQPFLAGMGPLVEREEDVKVARQDGCQAVVCADEVAPRQGQFQLM